MDDGGDVPERVGGGFNETNAHCKPLKRKGLCSKGWTLADGWGRGEEGGSGISSRKRRSQGSWVICSRADLMKDKARKKGKGK